MSYQVLEEIEVTDSKSTSSGGIGLSGALTVLFVGLKLGKVIDWPWIWVLSPLWISASLAVLIIIVVLIVVAKKS